MNALSVKDLRKIYPNGVVALNGINLDVAEGDFFALLGPNGAGKSTTIGIICSLINKTSGKINILGYDTDIAHAKAKAMIGIVPQEINFSQFEKISNILINQAGFYGIHKSIAIPRMEMYLQEMGLWDARELPAFRLSGGMKRRLMIARALMNEPRLLILDEPTAGVDVELRHLLWRFLTKLNQQGTTIILTTHYLEEAERLCKHVAIINHGEIIEHANMKALINRMHVQTIILNTDKPLWESPTLSGYHARLIDETTIEVEIQQGQSINELVELFTNQHIQIIGIQNKTNRLEELFMYMISATKNDKGRNK